MCHKTHKSEEIDHSSLEDNATLELKCLKITVYCF